MYIFDDLPWFPRLHVLRITGGKFTQQMLQRYTAQDILPTSLELQGFVIESQGSGLHLLSILHTSPSVRHLQSLTVLVEHVADLVILAAYLRDYGSSLEDLTLKFVDLAQYLDGMHLQQLIT